MKTADLHAKIADRFGLLRRPFSEAALARAAEEHARRLDVPLAELLGRLERDAELARKLVGHLTVDETYFLRQPEHFELALDWIQRTLASTPGRRVTLWSAGCAHGEEPYSAAVLVSEKAPWARPFVRVLGSDLSDASIAQAREGRFSDWSMRDTPDWFRARYFQRTAGGWQLDAAIRAMVGFEHLAVVEHLANLPNRSIDVVFFRNVAIYLEPSLLARVYEGFARILADDGLLLLGASDPPPSRQLFNLIPGPVGSAYRRAGAVHADGARTLEPVRRVPSPPPALLASTPARPPVSVTSEAQALYDRAVQLGNQGANQLALEHADRFVAAAPGSSAGYVLRATLLLAVSRHREALADLRHAAYLAPEEALPRFLCATALRAVGLAQQARAEARELAGRLRKMPSSARLEDGRTTVAELLGAALELAEEKG